MKLQRSLCLASALALAVGSAPARAQSPADIASAEAALNFVQRLAATYVVLIARAAVDLTYDSLTIDTGGQETVINGLVLRPDLDWDTEGACAIAIDRVAATSSPSLEVLESVIELSGVSVPAACFDPGTGAMLSSFGYPTLGVDRAAITIAYDVPSSGAHMLVSADIPDAADITVSADFDYVWFTGLLEGDDPEPVAKLASAELVLENAGLWERVSPMLGQQFGDLNQIPAMVGPMLGQMLAEPGQAPGADAQAFIDNLSSELARFIENGDRLVLSIEPEGGLWLSDDIFDTPQSTLAALQPRLSGAPIGISRMLSPSELSAAMSGGGGLDEATRLKAGAALITGIGAPKAQADGIALLAPMANAWNAEAAKLVADALAASGQTAEAYDMALKAAAGGAAGATGAADALEARLGAAEVLAAQAGALESWPALAGWINAKEAAQSTGDIAELRRLAFAASAGRGMPRSYREAYYLAALAAAGGDSGAAALRDRIDTRFTDVTGTREAAWVEAGNAAASAALGAWTGGIANQVMTRYGVQ
ncbi:hypothetical protein LNKW23_05510 [Paralimibaculum aggregatum]|uniref:Uncharacterized protein n=1 Tax=Paralimibaculum aggregatum TaxID=3036245 RepID=A0ABQ6LKM3_9RHOB|nr:hypothetical protein [Limibaculum sp. NKW23]GMG81338.1 hypothetical protein LNKW23_05510 [Limibaculum sp. NKW23]